MATGIQLAPPPNPYSNDLAQALLQEGLQNNTVRSPLEGLGQLAEVLVGAHLNKITNDKNNAYQQQGEDALSAALLQQLAPQTQGGPIAVSSGNGTDALTNGPLSGLTMNLPAGRQIPTDPTAAAAVNLMTNRDTPVSQAQGNQLGLQAVMSQQKEATQDRWVDLTPEQKKARGYNTLQAIQQNVDTGETRAVGSPQYDPTQVAKTQTTTTRDENGNLVKRVVGTNKAGDIINTQDLPAIEKAMPVQEQNKVDAVMKASAISALFRDIVTQGNAQHWMGPVSGPLAMKAQALGFNDVGGDMAQAFAAAKEHYIAALNGIIPQRGKYILETLDRMCLQVAYSPQRDLIQLGMTEGLIRGVAANTVKGYTNTEYHIDPDLFTLAKQAGYDPADPKSATRDYLPSLAAKMDNPQSKPASVIQNGNRFKLVNGQYVYDGPAQ